MQKIFFLMLIVSVIFLIFTYIKYYSKICIDIALRRGTVHSISTLKGDVFFKKVTTHKGSNESKYLSYIRLDNGKEILLDEYNFYKNFKTGDIVDFNKIIYKYKTYKIIFYLVDGEDLEGKRLAETVEFLNN